MINEGSYGTRGPPQAGRLRLPTSRNVRPLLRALFGASLRFDGRAKLLPGACGTAEQTFLIHGSDGASPSHLSNFRAGRGRGKELATSSA
jgi:hypothetical protein